MLLKANKLANKLSPFFLWLSSMPTASVLIPIQGISLVLWWILGSYFGIDTYASRSIAGDDGWCTPETQGLGVHCWGDYYGPIILLGIEPDPWSGPFNPYPAAAFAPFVIAQTIGSLTGLTQAGLFIYLFAMAGSICWSVWLGTKNLESGSRILLFSALTFFSPPVIMALDRGNSVGFAVPLLVWFFLSLKNHKKLQSIFAVAILTVIKPHFILLVLFFIIRGGFKSAVGVIGLSGLINIIPFFLIGPQAFPANVMLWFTRTLSYQDYSSVTLQWPQNMSFSQGLYSTVYVISRVADANLDGSLSFIAANQGEFGLIVLGATVLGLALFRSSISDTHLGIVLVSLVAMTSGTSFYYYGVFAAPALLALMATRRSSSPPVTNADTTRRITFVLWCALIGTHIQIPLFRVWQPPGLAPDWVEATNDVFVPSTTLVGLIWIFAYLAVFIIIAQTKFKKSGLRLVHYPSYPQALISSTKHM
jgi:hypothetical protein